MYAPPRCAYRNCPNHRSPSPGFYTRHGHYRSRCKPHPIPRFKCRVCGRTFSRQSFRMDCGDRKPHLNSKVVLLLCSGVGFRQTARILKVRRKNLEAKARKISRHIAALEDNQLARIRAEDRMGKLGSSLALQFDEFESYETRRNTRPLSIPVVIETLSRFRFAASAATIRPRGKMTEARRKAIETEDRRFGRRMDRSRAACLRVLKIAARARPWATQVTIDTDEKSTYPKLIARAFRGRQIGHSQTSSRAPRHHGTPLGPINLTEAILRDHMGRLRRESWLVSKERSFLNLHLRMINGFRNWVRPRFNRDLETPAQIAGFAPRRLGLGELLGWRQDWGGRSPCPFRGCGSGSREAMAV